MGRSFRIDLPAGRARRVLLAGALAASLGSCAEISTVADVVFPSTVPGLPGDQGWDSLPLRRWLTEPGVQPVAISACFGCRSPAVAGLFQARGRDAAVLRAAASDPRALLASLTRGSSASRRRGRRLSRVHADVVKAQEGGVPGLAIRLKRGRGSVGGYVATVERSDTTRILVIVAASEAEARNLARGILPRL